MENHSTEVYEQIEENRARIKMETLSASQLTLIMRQCGLDSGDGNTAAAQNRSQMIDSVINWRRNRGDFSIKSAEDEDVPFLANIKSEDHDLVTLPFTLQDVNEGILIDHLTKCDLQFECLRRNIHYNASHDKTDLFTKLMDFKDSFNLLDQESGDTTSIQAEAKPDPPELYHKRQVARARRSMNQLSEFLLQSLVENCGLQAHAKGRHEMIDLVTLWRRNRGDFNACQLDNCYEDKLEAVVVCGFLPFSLKNVDEDILTNQFCKCDLQLECLLRNVAYQASDDKPTLITKLMEFKKTYDEKPTSLYEKIEENRATIKTEILSDFQLALLMEHCGLDGDDGNSAPAHNRAQMIDSVINWRRNRGDFSIRSAEDEDAPFFANIKSEDDLGTLPFTLQDVNEAILVDHLTKCDLQFECLLRDIDYNASHDKVQLISKLMHFKGTFNLLDQESGDTSSIQAEAKPDPQELYHKKQEARARRSMNKLSEFQLQSLVENCRLQAHAKVRHEMIDLVILWRRNRGDFNACQLDDCYGDKLEDDVDCGFLTFSLKDVDEDILTNQFCKCDLQLECLLRNVPYQASDDKPILITKLMEFKETYVEKPTSLYEEIEENRARIKIEILSDSQLALLMEHCGRDGGDGNTTPPQNRAQMIDYVINWRRNRGDFCIGSAEDEDARILANMVELRESEDDLGTLPFTLQDVNKNILVDHLTKCDLQLECLLRNIDYDASHDKVKLISKLMHFKDTLFHNSNTFNLLDQESGDITTALEAEAKQDPIEIYCEKQEARARHNMEQLSKLQLQSLVENCGLQACGKDQHEMIDLVIMWRCKRGDFNSCEPNEFDEDNAFSNVVSGFLPFTLDDVYEGILIKQFCKCDLQLECLLRNIDYEASDDKPTLIAKLMEFNETNVEYWTSLHL